MIRRPLGRAFLLKVRRPSPAYASRNVNLDGWFDTNSLIKRSRCDLQVLKNLISETSSTNNVRRTYFFFTSSKDNPAPNKRLRSFLLNLSTSNLST